MDKENIVTNNIGPEPTEAGVHFMQYVNYKLASILQTNGYQDAEWTTSPHCSTQTHVTC